MKSRKKVIIFVTTWFVLVLAIWGVTQVISKNTIRNAVFRSVFYPVYSIADNQSGWHFMIYLDVKACLACTEDMSAWKELEERLPECGASFSLFAPQSDSFDVAYAMELEGLKTQVRVLGKETLDSLGWTDKRTPIKVLLDNSYQPLNIKYSMSNPKEARQYLEQLLSEVCINNE
ncbi:MAG: hypothetical protein ACE5D6_03570 [Candidatus Zixiibacteriota bacterium]